MTRIKILILFLVTCITASAQKKPVKPGAVKPVLSKIIKLKTLLGKNENGATVPVDEAAQLINFPLRVLDINNERCTILSYHFMYKRKGIVENETTGKKEISFTSVGDLFTQTPLPQMWRDNMSEGLKKDEEFYFYDIVIKDKLGRRMFAPELKIRIQ